MREWLNTVLTEMDEPPDAHNPFPNARTSAFVAVCMQHLEASRPLTLKMAVKLGQLAAGLRGTKLDARAVLAQLA
ncbi:hypothetical protein AB4Y45_34360 [Paraburkholderia sp. EG287A]|uniref:hypothetical protein n=1 Tax=Paraburkholderia sp. EG287A TaxID=3237012 RepID=UPI0034D1ECA4